MIAVPITFREAVEFIRRHHRHHKPPVGCKFCVAASIDHETIDGVIVVGRPVSRHLDNGWTAEVTRLAVREGAKNVCSFLLSRAWAGSRALGYTRLISYILASESGVSLKASGWSCVGQRGGGSWDCKSRPRVDHHPIEQKTLWERV